MIRRSLLVGMCAAAVAVGACGGDNAAVDAADDRVIEPLDVDALPGELLGLSIEREDIGDILDGTKRPYLDAASLYSFRLEEELQATLQVGRFADVDQAADEDFRATLLGTVGAGSIRELLVGGEAVYLTTGDRQQVAVWFEDEYLLILSTREDFEQSRGLLRATMELDL